MLFWVGGGEMFSIFRGQNVDGLFIKYDEKQLLMLTEADSANYPLLNSLHFDVLQAYIYYSLNVLLTFWLEVSNVVIFVLTHVWLTT